MARDYQPPRRHSTRLSRANEDPDLEATAALEAEASGIHLASDDYPELGTILRDRPDPGSVISVVGSRRTARDSYRGQDDPRDEDYNGGPNDTGAYWAEPAQQAWMHENLPPQEPVPPPPWAPSVMGPEMDGEMPPALARLAQIEEARHLFGARHPGARHRATTINGTHVDDHGDAPGHGTVPRASDPGSYDERSTEGEGDPKWSEPMPDVDKRAANGALVAMYPEGMSAGGGPGLEIGPYVAHQHPQGAYDMEQHLTGEHGVSPADLSSLRLRAWNTYPEELERAHARVSAGQAADDWLGDVRVIHGRPMNHAQMQDHLYREHGTVMTGGHSPHELHREHVLQHARSEYPGGEHHGPPLPGRDEGTDAPDEHGPDAEDAATWVAHPGPIDPVFGSRVPWTGAERGTLHSWQDVPTGTWGDFVPSGEFLEHGARRSPEAREEAADERARELRTGGRLAHSGPDPAGEAAWAEHLLNHHGWNQGNIDRTVGRGERLSHMHDALHSAGLSDHAHQDPAEAARQAELSSRFGEPFQAHPGSGHPGQGGTRFEDPGAAILNAAPRDFTNLRTNVPFHTWSSRQAALDPPHPHDDDDSSLDSGPSEGDEGFPELHDDLQSPDDWPLAQAGAPAGPAYTQGSQDGHGGRVFPPPPPAPMPQADGEEPFGEEGGGEDGKGKKIQLEIKAHLAAFTAAAADPRFRFEFTASWSDVVAKARRIRREGHVRITHASAGMVIGEVRGDHDTYETGIQRPAHKPQTIQHWACGCPWASFHQDKSLGARYSGRPCSHVMALQFEAQARGMFGKAVARDEQAPAWSRGDVTVKSWPPYEGKPHGGHWSEYWIAPSASLHRAATPDEARDRDWAPEDRDAWESHAGPRVSCYYRHDGPCPSLGTGRTAESLKHPRPRGFRSEIIPNPEFDPRSYNGDDTSTHVMNGYLGGRLAGQLHFSRSDDGQAYHVGMLHTIHEPGEKNRGKGVGSAMMDDLYSHVRQNGQWLDHGERTTSGNGWWASYREPFPEVNVHNAHPDEGWKDYFSPHVIADDMAVNYSGSGGRGMHTRLTWRAADYPHDEHDEKWQQHLGLQPPAWGATAALLAAGEDPGELTALARLGGLAALVRTADQANAPWGSENVSKHPPQKPYGATEPPNPAQSPASYGFLSAPDPDNWGGIQDDIAQQMPLGNTASHQVLAPTARGPLPPGLNYPDVGDFREDQESFGYTDRASTAGPSTSLSPRDPGGIRMEESLDEGDGFPGPYPWGEGGRPPRYGGQQLSDHPEEVGHYTHYEADPARLDEHLRIDHGYPAENLWGAHDANIEQHRSAHDWEHTEGINPWRPRGAPRYVEDYDDPPDAARYTAHDGPIDPVFGAARQAAGTPFTYRGEAPQLDGALAELRDEPEPALPSTTGDDIEATAAADGTIGGEDAAGPGDDQSPSPVAGLGEFGASSVLSAGVRRSPVLSGGQLRTTGGTPMGDLARETFPQAQQPSPVTQEPGTGSMDELLSPDNPSIQTTGNQQWSGGGADSDEVAVPAGQPQGSLDDIVAAFQRSAVARQFSGGSAGPMADGDIASAARQYLSKTADVLPDAEASELIAEGRGQRARNLGLLRLEGTHYEDQDEDLARRGVSLDDYDDDVIST